ncbi:transient receptor potential cation channel subfamily M member 2-like isoform X2 [Ambystoma mexicanum]|uniref:transient receptor potential cation channel subfamily M member 2-like isoform X2 n=1 Tax=Ambystoma mexicanum TaxID=8296 RepID=UPI0037E820BD
MSIFDSGEFIFKDISSKVLKYARVSHDTPPEDLFKMMRDEWDLSVPNLLLSVTGGAKDFIMKPRLKNLFSKGLVKAAQTTGAWIITGGTHAGVMKHVGEAARDFTRTSSSSYMHREIVVLGVAPWGAVHNADLLSNKEGDRPAEYILDEKNQGRLCCLDTNHTHFILVDDGSQGRYGVEIPLRTRLEKFISEQTVTKGDVHIKVPVVCVALEGGKGTLDTIHQSMTNNTPCVIVEGSGRVADVITQVANLNTSEITVSLIKDKLCNLFEEKFAEEAVTEWTQKVQHIVGMSQLLTIFTADVKGARDIDVAILQALLKACQSLGSENWDYQMKLAVSWNRIQVARNIFSKAWQWEAKDLHPVMTLALIENKPKFVQFFLDCGVLLREYVTPEVLTVLYNSVETSSLIYRKLKRSLKEEELPPNLKDAPFHVAHILKRLLGGFTKSGTHHGRTSWTCIETSGSDTIKCIVEPTSMPETLQYPIRDLLIWAVLQNRAELAEIFWSQSQDCILGALACCAILKKISKEVEDKDTLDGMRAQVERYEELAMGVLSECCKQNDEQAEKLLTRVSYLWGKTTCLQMALNAHAMNFMSHGGVQMLLTKVWWGNLAVDNGLIQVLLCMLFFPLIFTGLVTFRTEPIHAHMKGVPRPRSCCQRLAAFYAAPVVVFYWNVIAYVGFLWLFAYVLMIDFQTAPSWREYTLYAWTFTIFCEELRQSFYDPEHMGFVKKCKLYILNFWNQVDVLALSLFAVGIVCRFIPLTLYAGRIILSLDFAIFCFRLMHIFAVSKVLGPKIIMMWRMIKDIFSFLFLLAVWIASFGVSKQAITVHNEKRLNWIFWNVIYKPYLTLFGEIPSDVYVYRFDEDENRSLLSWEAESREDYLLNKREEKRQSTEQKTRETSEKVDKVLNLLESDHAKPPRTMEQRLDVLETQVSQCSQGLNWIMKAMAEKGFGANDTPPFLVPMKPHEGESPGAQKAGNAHELLHPDSKLM